MILLALDLGTTTGWACGGEREIDSGTITFKSQRFEGGGMRFLRFSRWLTELHGFQHFTEVVFEEVRGHKGVDAAHIYGGMLAHLTAWCEKKKIPYLGIPVGTIKKFATGTGNAGKELVIENVKKWGFAPKDSNEADAIALLRYHVSTL